MKVLGAYITARISEGRIDENERRTRTQDAVNLRRDEGRKTGNLAITSLAYEKLRSEQEAGRTMERSKPTGLRTKSNSGG